MTSTLSDMPIFAGLSPAECAEFEHRMRRLDYAPQSAIVREGGAGDAAYLILSGLVAVRRKDPDSGMEFLLAELGPGQMFGEMALLTSKPRSASVVALERDHVRGADARRLRARDARAPGRRRSASRRRSPSGSERANQHAGVDFVNLSRMQIDPRVLTLLPAVARQPSTTRSRLPSATTV